MAVDFTPASDNMKVAAHADFAGSIAGAIDEPHSYSMWLEVDNLGADRYLFSQWQLVNQYYALVTTTGQVRLWHFDPGTGKYLYIYSADGVISTGTKYHLTLTYDGSENASGLKCYINGVISGTGGIKQAGYNGMQSYSLNPFFFGSFVGGNGWDGLLEDFRVWNSVVAPKHIATLASGFRGPIGDEIAWWNLQLARGSDGGALSQGTHTFQDLSGNGHDADPYGSPSLVASDFLRYGVAL